MASTRGSIQSRKRFRLAALVARPAAPTTKPQVAITEISAKAVREPASGRSYVIVSVQTDAGITGLGETVASPDPRTAVTRILEQKQRLVAQDALAAQTVNEALTRSATSATELAPAQAAINMALLDILGKIAKAPVYEVLSGRTRQKARAFAHLRGKDEAALKASLERARSAGFRAFQAPLLVPEGPTRGRTFYRRTHRLLESLRASAGEDSDFILDCAGQVKPSEAAGLAAELERFHLLWLEEPASRINRRALVKISSESSTPLGLGRDIIDNAGFQDLLRMDAVDVLRPDIARMGITEIRKAAALAETYYVALAPFHRGGPIGTAAALHTAASIPNFFILEVPFPADDRDLKMHRDLVGEGVESVTEGFLDLPSGPGLGVTLNEDAVREYEIRS